MRIIFISLISFLIPGLALAEEVTANLRIKNHSFEPADLHVPAGKSIKLIVRNDDVSAEEFESHALNREKMIGGGRQAVIMVGPLSPGSYEFFGEFHPQTARGWLIAEEQPQQKTPAQPAAEGNAAPAPGGTPSSAQPLPQDNDENTMQAVPPLGGGN